MPTDSSTFHCVWLAACWPRAGRVLAAWSCLFIVINSWFHVTVNVVSAFNNPYTPLPRKKVIRNCGHTQFFNVQQALQPIQISVQNIHIICNQGGGGGASKPFCTYSNVHLLLTWSQFVNITCKYFRDQCWRRWLWCGYFLFIKMYFNDSEKNKFALHQMR